VVRCYDVSSWPRDRVVSGRPLSLQAAPR